MENFLLRTEKFKNKTIKNNKQISLVNKRSIDSFDKLDDYLFSDNNLIDC